VGQCRVVVPEVVRLPLSEGDWIDIKKELNTGEYYDLLAALVDKQAFARPLAYIVGWSFVGLDGKVLPYNLADEGERRDTLRSLDKATVREIVAALDRHEQKVDAERAAKKNKPGGETELSPISRSAA